MPEPRLIQDIDYLSPDREEKMDAYIPGEGFPGPHPAIVLIHGGGWRISDKAADREINIGTTLAREGFAVFSINYLLNVGTKDADGILTLSKVAWPQNFYDCKSAVRYLRKNAHLYNLEPSQIAVMGGSAGGHLAMMVGSTIHHERFNAKGLYTSQSNQVSCILNFYGDYDIRGRRVSPFVGSTPEFTKANETDASPITWIDSKTPPMFIVHGTDDTTIPVERSRKLAEHLNGLGLSYAYLELTNTPHTFDLTPPFMDIQSTVVSFLKKHLGSPPTEKA